MTCARAITVALCLLCLGSCTHRVAVPGKQLALHEFSNEQLRVFLKGHQGDWRRDTDQSRLMAPPDAAKPYPSNEALVHLVNPLAPSMRQVSAADAIANRRSRRGYSSEAISSQELSFLLWSTQGISGVVRDSEGQPAYSQRTVPSAGGRYPIETYVAVQRVEDLPPGIYRYIPARHMLLRLRAADEMGKELLAACYNRTFVGDAAAVFIWAAVPYRTEWRYTYLAHRMIAMEAGHIGQALYIAAEAAGLGACTLLGYDQAKMDTMIGVDGHDEFTVYMATVGKRKQAEGASPSPDIEP